MQAGMHVLLLQMHLPGCLSKLEAECFYCLPPAAAAGDMLQALDTSLEYSLHRVPLDSSQHMCIACFPLTTASWVYIMCVSVTC